MRVCLVNVAEAVPCYAYVVSVHCMMVYPFLSLLCT